MNRNQVIAVLLESHVAVLRAKGIGEQAARESARRAVEELLAKIGGRRLWIPVTLNTRGVQVEERDQSIVALWREGVKPQQLKAMFGVSIPHVYRVLGRRKKKVS